MPTAITGPHLLSYAVSKAKPTIWTEVPIKAAHAAKGTFPMEIATQIATEEIGAVKAIPTSTEIIMHIKKGTTEKDFSIIQPRPIVI